MSRFEILYEDDQLLAIDKLAPLPVQADRTGSESLQDILASSGDRHWLQAAHRVDRRASGIVLFAKTHRAAAALGELLAKRRVEKTYIAAVEHEPAKAEARLCHRIVRDRRRNRSFALPLDSAEAEAMSRPDTAVLEYRISGRSERYVFIETRLITGRTHQIRAQFTASGFPIRGDVKYGARRTTPNGLIMLHAWKISLPHPVKRETTIELTAPFPPDEPLWKAFVPLAGTTFSPPEPVGASK